MKRKFFSITLPVFNEEAKIYDYLCEISSEFPESNSDFSIIVVDDCSSDKSADEVLRFASNHPLPKVELIRNETNRGHGPSTIEGIKHAIAGGGDYIITTDGDAQITGEDIGEVAKQLQTGSQVVEGVRLSREKDIMRRFISTMSRILISLLSGTKTRDANTPLRGYQVRIISLAIKNLDPEMIVPNLFFSYHVRQRHQVTD